MWTRSLIKTNAREVFLRNYWPTVLTYFVYGLIVGGAGALLALTGIGTVLVQILIGGPMGVSLCYFALRNRRGEGQLEDLFYCFKSRFGNIILVTFMQQLFIFLWSLLFVIPGIIKGYEYRMVPYLVAENPDIDYKEALERSRAMMDGEKWNAFVLDLSFLGWWILTGFTCGILSFFWTTPYVFGTNTELYEALKAKTGINSGVTVEPTAPAAPTDFVQPVDNTWSAPVQAPVEAPAEAPVDAAAEAPIDAPAEAPADTTLNDSPFGEN